MHPSFAPFPATFLLSSLLPPSVHHLLLLFSPPFVSPSSRWEQPPNKVCAVDTGRDPEARGLEKRGFRTPVALALNGPLQSNLIPASDAAPSRFKHVYRQYACAGHYRDLYQLLEARQGIFNSTPVTLTVLPLGWTKQTGIESTKHASDNALATIALNRPFKWSFSGSLGKSGRNIAVQQFQMLTPHWVNPINKKYPETLSKSHFVLSPRGNVNLDCFRHYEASMHGAIPIVAGPQQEMEDAFHHFATVPPWLFAESFEQARERVQVLLGDRQALHEAQLAVVTWWRDEWHGLRRNISDQLHLRINATNGTGTGADTEAVVRPGRPLLQAANRSRKMPRFVHRAVRTVTSKSLF